MFRKGQMVPWTISPTKSEMNKIPHVFKCIERSFCRPVRECGNDLVLEIWETKQKESDITLHSKQAKDYAR